MAFLIRHGSIKRRVKSIDEWDSSRLSLKGILESKRLARWLSYKEIKYDKIYSSDIPSAMQTANIISNELGIKVSRIKQLREFRINYKKPEKLACMQKRVRKFISSQRFSLNQNIIIVAHKGIIREILRQTKQYKNPFKVKIHISSQIPRYRNNVAILQAVTKNLEQYIKENPGDWCLPDDYFDRNDGSHKPRIN